MNTVNEYCEIRQHEKNERNRDLGSKTIITIYFNIFFGQCRAQKVKMLI
jgi:hypothetical protein